MIDNNTVHIGFLAPRVLLERLDAEIVRLKRDKPFIGCNRSALIRMAINDMFERLDYSQSIARDSMIRQRTRK